MSKKIGCKPYGFAIIEKGQIKKVFIYCDKNIRDSAYRAWSEIEKPFGVFDIQKIDKIQTIRSNLKRRQKKSKDVKYQYERIKEKDEPTVMHGRTGRGKKDPMFGR